MKSVWIVKHRLFIKGDMYEDMYLFSNKKKAVKKFCELVEEDKKGWVGLETENDIIKDIHLEDYYYEIWEEGDYTYNSSFISAYKREVL